MKFVVTNTIRIYAVLNVWAAVASEIRIHSYSSKYGGAVGCPLSAYCRNFHVLVAIHAT